MPYHLATTPLIMTEGLPTEYDFNQQSSMFERAMRFELTAFSLARRRSTTELHPRFLGYVVPYFLAESAETQDRTGDTAIFSRVLYLLSYLGKNILLLKIKRP